MMLDAPVEGPEPAIEVDLFGQPSSWSPAGRRITRAARTPADTERAARIVEAHPDFRIQRRLRERALVGRRPLAPSERLVVILDTETTGLAAAHDEVIELGMLAVAVDASGRFVDALDAFNALREPSVPIPPEVTRLTGITPAMVAGRSIDAVEIRRFVGEASIVVAHNAQFDRPFCEGLDAVFRDLDWACSVREVDWSALGFEGSKLAYLVGRLGFFYEAHRAIDDCHALLTLLASDSPSGETIFSGLLASAARPRFRVWAERAPFEAKDRLKARRYRWSDGSEGRPRCWWTEIDQNGLEDELEFLRREVYGWDASPRIQKLTALDRYRQT